MTQDQPWQPNAEVQRLQALIQRHNQEAVALNLRHSGLINLFNAACVVNDHRDMENLREQVHGIVDNILDSNATLHMLTRQLTEAIGRS